MKVELSKRVVDYLCYQADIGYETLYKQERMGFLFGRALRNSIRVSTAVFYRGGKKGRTGITYNPDEFVKRGRQLASLFKKKWLGSYHSHVEETGQISFGFSPEDKKSFMAEPTLVELVVTVWSAKRLKMSAPGRKRLLITKKVGRSQYRYIMSAYVKTTRGPRLVKAAIFKHT
jgi:hypothetical protein